MRYKNTFRTTMLEAIEKLSGTVVLRADVNALGSPSQVTRALKALVEDGELIKLGYGVYAKATVSPYLKKPVLNNGFTATCIEALDKLNIAWEEGQAVKDYNAGRSTQVPIQYTMRLNDRYRGQLRYNGRQLKFEHDINAR